MAISGNFSGKTSNQFVKPTIYWSAVQNLLENYSDVTVELRYSRTNTGYTTQGSFSGAIYIDRGLSTEQKVTGKKSVCTVTYKSNTLAMTAAFRVYHESNGSKSITLSATGAISGTSVESTTICQLITLDTIPRASTIGAADGNIGAVTAMVVAKKNAAYRHSIAYRFGSLSGYVTADGGTSDTEVIFSESSIAFRVPEAFYGQIPKAKSGSCQLTCRTYSGTTPIGDAQTASFTATADKSLCAPTVSGSVADVNEVTKALTGDENILVRYHSTARCAITAAAKCSASLVSQTVNSAALASALEIPAVQTGSFTFGVTDSRGYTATEKVTKNLIPYVKLTANAAVKRTDPTSGRAILTVKGNYFAGSFGTAENTLTLSYRVGSGETVALTPTFSGNTYSATAELEGLAYDRSFPVAISAEDRLEQVHANVTVAKGIPTFEWGEGDFQFHVPVTFNRGIKDRNIKTYSSLEQLGFSGGVTTDAVFSAMPTWSMAVITNSKTSGNYLTDRPTDYCNVVLFKSNADYGSGIATKVNSSTKETYVFDWYNGGSHNGWTKVAKASEIADHRLKTFYSITQFGMSGQPTTDEVLAAMPVMSCLICDNRRGNDYNISDAPTGYCSIVLFKNQDTYGQGIAAKVNSSVKETFFYDWYKGGSMNAWTPNSNLKEVWTNNDPTGSFGAQTVAPGIGSYDMALVMGRLSTSTENELPILMLRVGGAPGNLYGVASGQICRRTAAATASGVTFGTGGKLASYSGSFAQDDVKIIPTAIYGIKGVSRL